MSAVAQNRVALPARSGADVAMRRLLRIPARPRSVPRDEEVHRLFSGSILISAVRCLLGYVLLPILTPVLHVAGALGPALGIPLGVVALVFDIRGMRRFFLADHRYRWPITALYLAVMVLVMVLLVHDIVHVA
ncbi:MAG: hypothetical protein ACRD0B_08045 [Acidimicrobiales bacterium]